MKEGIASVMVMIRMVGVMMATSVFTWTLYSRYCQICVSLDKMFKHILHLYPKFGHLYGEPEYSKFRYYHKPGTVKG